MTVAYLTSRCCQECGAGLTATQARRGHFCSGACRERFKNRRKKRGAQLYDLFMAVRYERDLAKKLNLWTVLCRMALGFWEEDRDERDGRKSWRDPQTVLEENLPLTSEVLVKNHPVGRPGRRVA